MSRTHRPARPTARVAETQLPNPPVPYPQLDRGTSQADAVQHAEREVSSGAIDDAALAAGDGELPYERVRHARLRIEEAYIAGQRADAAGTGDALVTRAKRGDFTERPAGLQNASVKGAKVERLGLRKKLVRARAAHRTSTEVLAGRRPDDAGCIRPGRAIAAETSDTAVLRRRLVLATVLEWAPPVALLLVEGAVVAGNMRKYLRADDADLLTPLAIAVVAVAILTLAPFFAGRVLADAAHGRRLSRMHRAVVIGAGAAWIGTAALLAMIRVSVDRAEAVDKAQQLEYDRAAAARALGQSADVVQVDPDAVFNPVLPTLFWMTVFLGFGVVMVLIELVTRNPARIDELALRIAALTAEARLRDAQEYTATLVADVEHQRRLVTVSDRQWQEELRVAAASADLDIATHLQALAQQAGSPDMLLAIERRLSVREPARGADASPVVVGLADGYSPADVADPAPAFEPVIDGERRP